MFDWNRVSRSGKDLAGVGGKPLTVSLGELAKHRTEGDVWTAYRGTYSTVLAVVHQESLIHQLFIL